MSDLALIDIPVFLAETRGPSIIATASFTTILITVFVGLRYYARYLTSSPFNNQDVVVPFAWLAEFGLCVTSIGKSLAPRAVDPRSEFAQSW
jgi:hypothetical protein